MKIFGNLLIIIIIFLSCFGVAVADGQLINKQSNFISTDYVEYNQLEQLIYADGNVQIILDDYFITANSLIYDIEQDQLWAKGDVRIHDKQNKVILGEVVILKDKLKEGVISDFILYFGDNTLLVSKLAERINKDLFRLHNSSFTPCKILCNQKPIWQISARDTELELSKNKMVYKHLFFEVYGVPFFYLPYFSHPTPKAKAESGILVPIIENKSLGIPVYYRAKPNLDFTLTPRIFAKYNIYELEARYKPNKSDYISLEANYGKVPYKTQNRGTITKNTNLNSYYILSKGSFTEDIYKYGFRLEHVSDKAYLKNYYQNYTPYLFSKVYLESVNNYNYLLAEGMNFEGLGAVNDKKITNPSVLPRIKTKNVIALNEDETSNVVIENDSLIYKEHGGIELNRISVQLAIENKLLTSSGHLFEVTLRDRNDAYFATNLNANDPRDKKLLTRTIPEIQNIWRFPLAGSISEKDSVTVEPIISATVGRKRNSNKKFAFIDPTTYELSQNNIFYSNRYSGIDFHEFGNRLSYGCSATIALEQWYSDLFLGQKYNTNINGEFVHHIENIGAFSTSFSDNIELFYKFRKTKNFNPITDEFGGTLSTKKLKFTFELTRIMNVRQNYFMGNINNSKIQQLYYNLSYKLTDNWEATFDMRLNLPKKPILSKSIKVTYLNDCVIISAKVSDDYMADNKRGIKKTISLPTISIGLKVLNM